MTTENEEIIDCGNGYEVHPGAKGGWTVVGPSGQPIANHADRAAAVRQAEELAGPAGGDE